jgi:hypothetical protein
MLNTVTKRRVQVLTLVVVLLVLLTATTALANTRLIRAKYGGLIALRRGTWFIVPPGSLEENTVISARMERENGYINFIFGPCGTTFAEDKPALLCITWRALCELGKEDNDRSCVRLRDIVLYSESGEEIDVIPEIKRWGVMWRVPHFSLYYYRRR